MKMIKFLSSFKIIGTNNQLQLFELVCKKLKLQVSSNNGYFRDDYEHCLIPCCFYDINQYDNIKLQLMHNDCKTDITYDLKNDKILALKEVELLNLLHNVKK